MLSFNEIELADIDFATLATAQKSLTKQATSTTRPSKSVLQSQSTKSLLSNRPSNPKSKSKNAPQEISSKNPVSRKRFLPSVTSQSHRARDPRFETLTKSTSQESSRKAYKFIEDYQRDEIALLKTQIRKSKDEYEREKLTKALQSLQSRKESREAKDRASDVLKAKKRDEREKVKLGKRPFYLKKSNLLIWYVRWRVLGEQKKLVMEDKYSKLGKKRLEKVLEKKRKKKEGKELRRMPRQRQ